MITLGSPQRGVNCPMTGKDCKKTWRDPEEWQDLEAMESSRKIHPGLVQATEGIAGIFSRKELEPSRAI